MDLNTNFKETLHDFLMKIMPNKNIDYKSLLKIDLEQYEFKDIDIILVFSFPGRVYGEEMKKYGIGKI